MLEPQRDLGTVSDAELLNYVSEWTGNLASDETVKSYGLLKIQVQNELLAPLLEAERERTAFIQALFQDGLPTPAHASRISSVRFHTQAEVQRMYVAHPEIQFQLQFLFVRDCGPNGMEQSGYALPSFHEGLDAFLLVCPGTVVAQTPVRGQNHGAALSSFQIIAHELSHSIDSRYFPNEFENYGRCLADSFAEELRNSSPPSERLALSPLTLVRAHMPEIAADLRATIPIARFLGLLEQQMKSRRIHRRHRYEVKLKALRNMYEIFCGDAPTDGLHPTGRLRIGTILGGDAQIRRVMGCRANTGDGLWGRERCTL